MNDILQLLTLTYSTTIHAFIIYLCFLQVSLISIQCLNWKKLRKTYSNKNIMYEMTFNKSSTPTAAAANFIVVMDWPLRKRASSFFLEVKCGLSLGPNHDPASLSEECFEKRKFSGFPHLNSLEQKEVQNFHQDHHVSIR